MEQFVGTLLIFILPITQGQWLRCLSLPEFLWPCVLTLPLHLLLSHLPTCKFRQTGFALYPLGMFED